MLKKGKYLARLAEGPDDLAAAQALRYLSFLGRRGLGEIDGRDADGFDSFCQHVLVETVSGGQLVCCYRLHLLRESALIFHSYAAQHYDLAALAGYPGPALEMGRFCLHPDWHDPDILRLAWAAMARIVDQGGVKLLFGCSSFAGIDAEVHRPALSCLWAHLAPLKWAPQRLSSVICPIEPPRDGDDPAKAIQSVPPLLRTYLAMGGWVSDHAVIDKALDTLHVFTAVEIDRIPPARARALRAIAQ